MGLGMAMATSTSSSPSFPPSVSSSIYSRVAGPVLRPFTVLSPQRQGPVVTVPEMRTTAARASDLALRTSLTLRPLGPERRRIMKKGSTLQTGVTDGSHEPLDGWTHISSSSTVSPTFPPPLLGSSSHVSVGFAASSEVGGTSQSDPQGPLVSVNQVETHKFPLKYDVSESRVLRGTLAGSTVELEVRGNSSLFAAGFISNMLRTRINGLTRLFCTLHSLQTRWYQMVFLFDFLHLSQWISSAAPSPGISLGTRDRCRSGPLCSRSSGKD